MSLQLSKEVLDAQWRDASDDAKAWLSRQLMACDDVDALTIALAMARRKVGTGAVREAEAKPWLTQWTLADVARVKLLLTAQDAEIIDAQKLVVTAYKQGDEYEKEAILKGLCLLDPNGSLVELAVDACRTNVLTMLSAIALENPYASAFFPEHPFNQMVLKCLFLGFDISRVWQLDTRTNPSMSRMCYDYLRERVAAGRDFPASIWLAIRLQDLPGAEETFLQYVGHSDERQRFYITRSITRDAPVGAAVLQTLKARLEDETSERICQLLRAATSKH